MDFDDTVLVWLGAATLLVQLLVSLTLFLGVRRRMRELTLSFESIRFKTRSFRTEFARHLRVSALGRTLEFFGVTFSILSVVTYVSQTYLGDQLWIEALELIYAVFFFFDFCLNLYAASNRWKFLRSLQSLVDVLTVVTIVVRLSVVNNDVPALHYLRILAVFRLVRFVRYYRLPFLAGAVQQEALQLALTIIVLVFCMTGLLHFVENLSSFYQAPNSPLQFHDAFYFTIITITTVGYGDFSPHTDAGKYVVVIMLILVVLLIPPRLGRLQRAFAARAGFRGSRRELQIYPHAVICAKRFSGPGLQLFIDEFFKQADSSHMPEYLSSASTANPKGGLLRRPFDDSVVVRRRRCCGKCKRRRGVRVVVLSEDPMDDEMRTHLSAYKHVLQFVQGSAVDEQIMNRVCPKLPFAVFLLFNPFAEDLRMADRATTASLIAFLRAGVPPSHVVVQLLQSSNRRILSSEVHSVVVVEEFKMSILARSVACPGLITLVQHLALAEPPFEPSQQAWQREYQWGVSQRIYVITVPPDSLLIGLRMQIAAYAVYRETGCALLAKLDANAPVGRDFVFLPTAGKVRLGDHLLVIGFNLATANSIRRLLRTTGSMLSLPRTVSHPKITTPSRSLLTRPSTHDLHLAEARDVETVFASDMGNVRNVNQLDLPGIESLRTMQSSRRRPVSYVRTRSVSVNVRPLFQDATAPAEASASRTSPEEQQQRLLLQQSRRARAQTAVTPVNLIDGIELKSMESIRSSDSTAFSDFDSPPQSSKAHLIPMSPVLMTQAGTGRHEAALDGDDNERVASGRDGGGGGGDDGDDDDDDDADDADDDDDDDHNDGNGGGDDDGARRLAAIGTHVTAAQLFTPPTVYVPQARRSLSPGSGNTSPGSNAPLLSRVIAPTPPPAPPAAARHGPSPTRRASRLTFSSDTAAKPPVHPPPPAHDAGSDDSSDSDVSSLAGSDAEGNHVAAALRQRRARRSRGGRRSQQRGSHHATPPPQDAPPQPLASRSSSGSLFRRTSPDQRESLDVAASSAMRVSPAMSMMSSHIDSATPISAVTDLQQHAADAHHAHMERVPSTHSLSSLARAHAHAADAHHAHMERVSSTHSLSSLARAHAHDRAQTSSTVSGSRPPSTHSHSSMLHSSGVTPMARAASMHSLSSLMHMRPVDRAPSPDHAHTVLSPSARSLHSQPTPMPPPPPLRQPSPTSPPAARQSPASSASSASVPSPSRGRPDGRGEGGGLGGRDDPPDEPSSTTLLLDSSVAGDVDLERIATSTLQSLDTDEAIGQPPARPLFVAAGALAVSVSAPPPPPPPEVPLIESTPATPTDDGSADDVTSSTAPPFASDLRARSPLNSVATFNIGPVPSSPGKPDRQRANSARAPPLFASAPSTYSLSSAAATAAAARDTLQRKLRRSGFDEETMRIRVLQNTLDRFHGHIVVTGGVQNLELLVTALRSNRAFNRVPIVLLFLDIESPRVMQMEDVFFVQGDCAEPNDLLRAGVTVAERVIVLSSPQYDFSDRLAILTANALSIVWHEDVGNPDFPSVIYELANPATERLLVTPFPFTVCSKLSPLSSSGRIYSSLLPDGLTCQAFFHPHVWTCVNAFVGLHDPCIAVRSVPIPPRFVSSSSGEHTYLELFTHCTVCLGVVPVAVMRMHQEGETEVQYCVTNPTRLFVLHADDRLLVFGSYTPDLGDTSSCQCGQLRDSPGAAVDDDILLQIQTPEKPLPPATLAGSLPALHRVINESLHDHSSSARRR